MTRAPASPAIAFAVCCLGVALFSVMDAAMKRLGLDIGLYNSLFWRSATGTVLGFVLMIVLRQAWPNAHVLRIHLLRGVVVAFMALSFFWAILRMPLAEAIALSFVAPLIALYLAALLLKERIGRAVIVASLLGIAGVAVILAGQMRADYSADTLAGAVAMLFSAVLFAYNLILQRQQAQLASPIEVAFFQQIVMLGVFGAMAVVGWFVPLPDLAMQPVLPPLDAWPLVVLATCLAFTSLAALAWAYARAEAQRLIPVEYSAFIWAAIMGWLVFGERLTATTLCGAALIVAGCIIAARSKPDVVAHVEPASA